MKTLQELEHNDCRWPVEYKDEHMFCASPRRDEKCSYCAEHAKIAFTPARGPRQIAKPFRLALFGEEKSAAKWATSD